MQFTLAVTNDGPSTATGITVIDLLPGGMVVTGAGGPGWICTPAASSVTCTLAALAPGATATIVLDANAPHDRRQLRQRRQRPGGDRRRQCRQQHRHRAVRGRRPRAADGGLRRHRRRHRRRRARRDGDRGRRDRRARRRLQRGAASIRSATPIRTTSTNPASYRLVEAGQDGLFATSVCGAVARRRRCR